MEGCIGTFNVRFAQSAAPATGIAVFGGFLGSEAPVPAPSVGRGRPGLAVGCRGCGGRGGCRGTVPSGRERWVSASSQPREPARSRHGSSSVRLMSNKCIKASGIPLASLFSSFPRGAGRGCRLQPWRYPCVPRPRCGGSGQWARLVALPGVPEHLCPPETLRHMAGPRP